MLATPATTPSSTINPDAEVAAFAAALAATPVVSTKGVQWKHPPLKIHPIQLHHLLTEGPKRVSFELDNNTEHDVFTKAEYDRQGFFDPEVSHAQWEIEEVVPAAALKHLRPPSSYANK